MISKFAESLTSEGGLLRVRAILALALTGAAIYLWVSGEPVPEELLGSWGVATGLYFGMRGGK